MIETIVGLFNQIVGFVVKLFYICLFIGILGLGFLNWLGMEVEKQRKLREGKGGETVRKLFILLAFLFLLPLPVLAADYTCRVCYEPVPTDKVVCETLMSPNLEGVQNMVIAAVESKSELDKVTVDCSFPDRTVKGYSGYIAEIKLRK